MPGRLHLDGDWFGLGLPGNLALGEGVYLDTSYCFALAVSESTEALTFGNSSGVYDKSVILTGPHGRIAVGAFACVNDATISAHDRVDIGDHALLGWGSVITDTGGAGAASVASRRAALRRAAADRNAGIPAARSPEPVVLEDNVWIGFDAVVGPGVRVGRGAVVGARSVVRDDVAPYTVVIGDPAREVGRLDPGDETDAARSVPGVTGPDARRGDAAGGSWITGPIRPVPSAGPDASAS